MKRPSVSNIRASLLLLVLLALIPSRGLGIYTTWEMRQSARAEALRDAMRLARTTSVAGERLIEGTQQVLTVLARLPEVRTKDVTACNRLFADLLKSYPQVSNLGAATPQGDVFCSAVPFLGAASVADRTYFQRAVGQRGFASGEYRVGQITGKTVINFAYPVFDGALLVTAVGARVLILLPVTALVQTMQRLGSGDLAARTGLPHTHSEFGRLATALDEMADRLEARGRGSPQPPG